MMMKESTLIMKSKHPELGQPKNAEFQIKDASKQGFGQDKIFIHEMRW